MAEAALLISIILLPISGGMFLAARRERQYATRLYRQAMEDLGRVAVIRKRR